MKLSQIVGLGTLAFLTSSVGEAAQMVYSVALDTSALAATSLGPFALNVQLNDGGTPNTNSAILSNFVFGGGAPLGNADLPAELQEASAVPCNLQTRVSSTV